MDGQQHRGAIILEDAQLYSIHILPSYTVMCVLHSAGILEQSIGARNRVGIGLSYRLARLHRQNRFLGYLKFKNTASVQVLSE
jgi:hypothetical protein